MNKGWNTLIILVGLLASGVDQAATAKPARRRTRFTVSSTGSSDPPRADGCRGSPVSPAIR